MPTAATQHASPINYSRVEVSTREYEFSHGKAPRGRGWWAFEIGGEVTFIKGEKTYREASTEARKLAAGKGIDWIKACP